MSDFGRNWHTAVYARLALERNCQQLDWNTLVDFHIVDIHSVMTNLLALTLKNCLQFLENLGRGTDSTLEFGYYHNRKLPPMEVVGKQKSNPAEVEIASAGNVLDIEA